MTGRTELLVLCNPLLDVVCWVDDAFLERHELKKGTTHIYTPKYHGLFEELEAMSGVRLSPGGAGLNTARVTQWILRGVNTDLAGAVTYIGCIGDDEHGRVLRRVAEESGVRMDLEVSKTHPTGTCAVCKVGESRTLVANLSAANSLALSHLSTPEVERDLADAKIVFTTAYATPFHSKATKHLANSTRTAPKKPGEQPKLFAMALSSTSILDYFGEELVDFLAKLDIILCNREEIRDLAMMLQWVPDEMSEEALVYKVATEMMYDKHAVRRVVVTRGSDPVLYATSEGEKGEVPVEPIKAGSVKHSTTGAGDAFAGGFLAALLSSSDMELCCRVGNKAAAYVIGKTIKALHPSEVPSRP